MNRLAIPAVFALLLIAQNLFGGVRIAILGDIDENRLEINCLTATLSKEPGVELLERSEIDRILKEQELSLANSSDESQALKIGAILGAQGMIIIKSFEWDGRHVLSARLVATRSGAILDAWVQDTPPKEAGHFSDAIRYKFVPLFQKLSIDRKDVIAISLLDIRSPVDTSEGKELERKITLLLSQRLMLDKSFVVLERWRLGNIAWEKELGLDANPLWTGSYMLDGSVESLPNGKGALNITLRLRKPGRTEPELIAVSGSTLDLKGLVESMVPPLKRKLGASVSESTPWDMAKEADFYFKEAEWLLRAGSYERAREAAKSAQALGRNGPELDILIAKTYQESVAYDIIIKLERFMRGADDYCDYRSRALFECYERDDAETHANALELFENLLAWMDILLKLPDSSAKERLYSESDSYQRIELALCRSVEALAYLYAGKCGIPDGRLLERAKLLRALCRKTLPAFLEAYARDHFGWRFMKKTYIDCIRFFPEIPEDSITLYKAMLNRDGTPFKDKDLRWAILSWPCKDCEWLADWDALAELSKSPDKLKGRGSSKTPRADKLWADFLDSLRSGSERDKIDATIFMCALIDGNRLKDAGKNDAESLAWKHKDEIFQMNDPLSSRVLLSAANSFDLDVKMASYAFSKDGYIDLQTLCSLLCGYGAERMLSKTPKLGLKLAEDWKSYKARNAALLSGKHVDAESVKALDAALLKYLEDAAPKKPLSERKFQAKLVKPAVLLDFFKDMGWTPPDRCGMDIFSCDWREGKLLISASVFNCDNRGYMGDDAMAVLCVKGASCKYDLFPMKDFDDLAFCRLFGDGRRWVLTGKYGKVFRKKASDSKWESIATLPFQNPEAAVIHAGKAYILYSGRVNDDTSPSGIVSVDLKNGSWETIASSRRNPPETPLDNCPSFSCTLFSVSGNGKLLVQISPRGNSWSDKDLKTAVCDLSTKKWETPQLAFKYGSYSRTPSTLWIGDLRGKGIAGFDMKTGELSSVPGMKSYLSPELEKLSSLDFNVYYGENLLFDGTNRIALSQLGWNVVQARLLSPEGDELKKSIVEIDSDLLRNMRARYGRIFSDGVNLYMLFSLEHSCHPVLVVLRLQEVFQ